MANTYTYLWERLKASPNGTIRLELSRAEHKNIARAIRRELMRDSAFLLREAELSGALYAVTTTSNGTLITIRLEKSDVKIKGTTRSKETCSGS